jgi:Putative transposase
VWKTLERLCRYITRPALANERVKCNAASQVELKLLKRPADALGVGEATKAGI